MNLSDPIPSPQELARDVMATLIAGLIAALIVSHIAALRAIVKDAIG